MKEFILFSVLITSIGSSSASCIVESLSEKENFNNCMVEAKRGDAVAQYNIAEMYYKGKGVIQVNKKAVKWYKKSASHGFPSAQHRLGVMYSNGLGVKTNSIKAARLFRKSAEQGYVHAQSALGLVYFNGIGVAQNDVLAHKWYNIASANGGNISSKYDAKSRDIVASTMTPSQIEEAQKLAREWMAKHQ